MSKLQDRALKYIRNNPGITTAEIKCRLKASDWTTRRMLDVLKSDGRITPERDPRDVRSPVRWYARADHIDRFIYRPRVVA